MTPVFILQLIFVMKHNVSETEINQCFRKKSKSMSTKQESESDATLKTWPFSFNFNFGSKVD